MISVIIPVYNKVEHVKDCIDSVLAQDVEKEVILVNDGSTDGSMEIVESYRDKVYRVLTHDTPRGAAFSRNTGRNFATGEYLLWLDADCVLEPDILRVMEDTLEKGGPAYSFVYGNFKRVGAFDDKDYIAGEFSLSRLIKANYISTVSLIRSYKAAKWNEDFKRLNDWIFWLDVCLNGAQGYYFNRLLFTAYYKDKDISTNSKDDYKFWFQKVAKKYYPIIMDKIEKGEIKVK